MKKQIKKILAAVAVACVALITVCSIVPRLEDTAQAADLRDPTFRTVTVQPSRSSAGTGCFIVYDKFGTQFFRINPTNLTFDILLSGTVYTPTNVLTQKFLSGTGVTNVFIVRNGFIVGVTNVP